MKDTSTHCQISPVSKIKHCLVLPISYTDYMRLANGDIRFADLNPRLLPCEEEFLKIGIAPYEWFKKFGHVKETCNCKKCKYVSSNKKSI